MRILLVNPPVYDFACFDFWLKPLGLLYIGSYLKENNHKVELFDFMDRHSHYLKKRLKEKDFGTGHFRKTKTKKPHSLQDFERQYYRFGVDLEKFTEKILKEKYDFIFITSMMAYWYLGVWEVIETVREFSSDSKIVLGGVYARLMTEHAQSLKPDVVFSGDLRSFEEFCNNRAGINIEKPFGYEDLVPLYELYDDNKCAAILTSLGCPLECTHCSVRNLNPKFVPFPIDSVLKQLDYLESIGIADVAFYDDAILHNKENHFIPLMKRVIEKKYKMRFNFSNGLHARYIDDEVASVIAKLNCGVIAVSVESMSGSFLKKNKGKTTVIDSEMAIESLLNAGVENKNLYAYMMVGSEDETLEDIIMTIESLRKKKVRVLINEMSPSPGSKLYEKNKHLFRDPLFTNNNVYPSMFKYDTDTVESIKTHVKKINRELHEQFKNNK